MEVTNVTTMPSSGPSFGPPMGFSSRLPKDDLGPSMRVAVWILASAATIFLTLPVCNTLSISLGFGKHIYQIPFSAFDSLNTIFLIGQLSMTLQICGHCWSKTSFALTLLMISDGIRGKTRIFIWFAIVSMNILFGIAALLFWIDCTPINKSWQPLTRGECWDPNIIITYNIFTSGRSIVFRYNGSHSRRYPLEDHHEPPDGDQGEDWRGTCDDAAASAFIKCSSLPELGSRDFPRKSLRAPRHFPIADRLADEGVPLVIWSGTENAVTIMAASVPMLRVLLKSVRPKKRRPRPRPIYETADSREFMLSMTSGKRSFYNKPRKDLATMTDTSTTWDLEG
ncbi:hypothetical protein GQ53DRAFT_792206 [Thozetella sp. PMI_491]|nr:hypothetical protein GQ53DRAFT_792206 [Thozetella sp. PMI_491]